MKPYKKTEFRLFTIFDWQEEQDYLREQHRTGWRFTHVNYLGCYHFEKCEPEDTVYQLDYNPAGTSYATEYLQLFRDCGWEYLQNFFGYSYFRKPAAEMQGDEEEIFCDDASRLDMMLRVFKGRMIPLIVLFIGVLLPQLFLQLNLGGTISHTLAIAIGVAVALYLILFINFGRLLYKYWKAARK